ncbi:hypothetical protein SUGI_0857540 [Cryptomeria japonica]|nr:hypothetical protein SUGI_0857540 [Cryptomeria japonica]
MSKLKQNFNAVVGIVAVVANRSKYVDFTKPYTETGLIMVVANSEEGSSDRWAFLRPFTLAMWITTVAFFFFTGGVVWFLEHKQNRQFRGNPGNQILTFIWYFSCSLCLRFYGNIHTVNLYNSYVSIRISNTLELKQSTPSIKDRCSLLSGRGAIETAELFMVIIANVSYPLDSGNL